jgi:hypothetical protein
MEPRKPLGHLPRLPLDLAAFLLFLAAALKGYSLLNYPTPPSGNFFEARWFQVLLAGGEIVFASLLVSTSRTQLATNLAIGVFFVFALFSLGAWWQGAESCGCFGVWSVHPRWTFLMDSMALVGLVSGYFAAGFA